MSEENNIQECSICLIKIDESVDLYENPCKHGFHKGCIERWLNCSRSCPMCRASIPLNTTLFPNYMGPRINSFNQIHWVNRVSNSNPNEVTNFIFDIPDQQSGVSFLETTDDGPEIPVVNSQILLQRLRRVNLYRQIYQQNYTNNTLNSDTIDMTIVENFIIQVQMSGLLRRVEQRIHDSIKTYLRILTTRFRLNNNREWNTLEELGLIFLIKLDTNPEENNYMKVDLLISFDNFRDEFINNNPFENREQERTFQNSGEEERRFENSTNNTTGNQQFSNNFQTERITVFEMLNNLRQLSNNTRISRTYDIVFPRNIPQENPENQSSSNS